MTAFREYVVSVERVEQRLRKVAAALDAAGVPYAVIDGNAVAAWVATADPSAVRATRDVDLLVNRDDLSRIEQVMSDLGFTREELRRLVMFTDPAEPSRRAGVHLVFAGERVRPSYAAPAPSPDDAVRDPQGFAVLNLLPLLCMKLTSYRDKDRAHLRDMLDVGLIDRKWCDKVPPELRGRLRELIDNPEE